MYALLALTLAAASPEADALRALIDRNKDLDAKTFLNELPKKNELTKLSFDPTEAEHYDRFVHHLSPTKEERELFMKNGFVVIDHQRNYSYGSAYYAIYTSDLPVLITADSIAYAVHKSFDDILMDLELQAFIPSLDRALSGADAAIAKSAATEATNDARLYLAVARALLAGKPSEDAAVKVLLERVKSLELETPDQPKTELYGTKRPVDWSQFQPRGHYTKAPQLEQYFRAMMWLGRADLGFRIDKSPRERAAAKVLADALTETKLFEEIESIGAAIDFFVGKKDGLDLADFAAGKTMEQSIRSESISSDPNEPTRSKPPVIVNLFPQRFVIDSFVLSEVVFDSILYRGEKMKRLMPAGLDVMAALGNDLAAELLAPELQTWNYATNLKSLRQLIAAQPQSFWSDTLYNLRLDASRAAAIDLSDEKHAPQAMKTRAWKYRQLEAQLAAWAELRHDTILYAKQSYTAFPSCEYPAGYVEPYPVFYQRVREFAQEGARRIGGLKTPKSTTARAVSFLEEMAKTAGKLETLAKKELRAEAFSSEEKTWLKKTIDIRGGGSGPPRYDGWYTTLFFGGGYRSAEWDPVVADVHTNPAKGEVLEVAAGTPSFLVIAVDNEDDRMVYVGPSASYYEFTQPASQRLTDEAWQLLLQTKKQPPRAPWMKNYRGTPYGRELKP